MSLNAVDFDDLINSTERSAVHLEMRDAYQVVTRSPAFTARKTGRASYSSPRILMACEDSSSGWVSLIQSLVSLEWRSVRVFFTTAATGRSQSGDGDVAPAGQGVAASKSRCSASRRGTAPSSSTPPR
ncbi:DUF6879 family protein [Streptomyces luteireticuli]|uniref:DUF6879 family protein n=1 Tax=Streptomyces luteireticuli TaxID=173858 RepID=UPI0031DD4620